MSAEIDFANISLRDMLDLAVFVEEEAEQRYHEFSDQMRKHHTADAAEFFRKLAAIEHNHAVRLGRRRKALFNDEEVTADSSLVIEVEAPEYEEVRAFMSPRHALEVALEAERKAYRFYDGALGKVEEGEVRELFEDLRAQEVQHQEMILGFMARLPAGSEVDPEGFVDDPTAQ